MNTDTLVESPIVSQWVKKSLEQMKVVGKEKDMPFVPEQLTPDFNNTFWVNLIGRGYPFREKIPLVHGSFENSASEQFHS